MFADLLSWPTTPSGAFVAVAAMVIFYVEIRSLIVKQFGRAQHTPHHDDGQPASNPIVTVKLDPAGLHHPDDMKRLQAQVSAQAQQISALAARLTTIEENRVIKPMLNAPPLKKDCEQKP